MGQRPVVQAIKKGSERASGEICSVARTPNQMLPVLNAAKKRESTLIVKIKVAQASRDKSIFFYRIFFRVALRPDSGKETNRH